MSFETGKNLKSLTGEFHTAGVVNVYAGDTNARLADVLENAAPPAGMPDLFNLNARGAQNEALHYNATNADNASSISGTAAGSNKAETEESKKEKERRMFNFIMDQALEHLRELERLQAELAAVQEKMEAIEAKVLDAETLKRRPGETEEQYRARMRAEMEEKHKNGEISDEEYQAWLKLDARYQHLQHDIDAEKKIIKQMDKDYQVLDEIRRRQHDTDLYLNELKDKARRADDVLTRLSQIKSQPGDENTNDVLWMQLMQDYPELADKMDDQPGAADMTTDEKIDAAQEIVEQDREQLAVKVDVAKTEAERLNVSVPQDMGLEFAEVMSSEAQPEQQDTAEELAFNAQGKFGFDMTQS